MVEQVLQQIVPLVLRHGGAAVERDLQPVRRVPQYGATGGAVHDHLARRRGLRAHRVTAVSTVVPRAGAIRTEEVSSASIGFARNSSVSTDRPGPHERAVDHQRGRGRVREGIRDHAVDHSHAVERTADRPSAPAASTPRSAPSRRPHRSPGAPRTARRPPSRPASAGRGSRRPGSRPDSSGRSRRSPRTVARTPPTTLSAVSPAARPHRPARPARPAGRESGSAC